MEDVVDKFRTLLSGELKAAMASRNKEDVNIIRGIMSALDNAGAISKEEIARLKESVSEVPRKKLSESDIRNILQAEIEIRRNALVEYDRLGNKSQVDLVHQSIATIEKIISLFS